MGRRALGCLAAALLCVAAALLSAAANDGGTSGASADAASDPCAAIAARIERRKRWLAARREEQFERGPWDPKRGVPNMVHVFCEAHPEDEDCLLGNAVIDAETDELTWRPDAGVDDFDPHLVAMRRALRECAASPRPSP